ncbi:MAG: hypothetical protein ACYCZ0_02415, partial [Minisyncoccota bacterium]
YFSQTVKASSWDFFVDKQSREGKILELARQLQREMRKNAADSHRGTKGAGTIRNTLQTMLAAA